MSEPLLVCYLPNGAPVWNLIPDEYPLADLGVTFAKPDLAQPDEANDCAPTVLSLPLDAMQEEAPIAEAGTTIGASEVGRQPSVSIADFA